ncbi:hypothetical protein L1049_007770 [Liquidambar formosana]|uniref:DDE Tnp4 domain-containing protein n=1 Tax=Liquidambar formosana TaxID=63359 RepID=A0AAP0X7R9_LIQFO
MLTLLPWWLEGTAYDSRIFVSAVTNPEYKFPKPPEGKCYVVDFGFTNVHGFLSPYRGERYHLQEYRGRCHQPTNAKELFNYRHSSLRNVIERCFEVLKKRFPILKMMPSYSLKKQTRIVIAACAIHNFIRMEAQQDILFDEYDNEELVIEEEQIGSSTPNIIEMDRSSTSRREMVDIRDRITRRLARANGIPR